MSHWSAGHAVPFILLSLLALLEVYANRLRRAGVASGDRGTLLIVMLLVGGGMGGTKEARRGTAPRPRSGGGA